MTDLASLHAQKADLDRKILRAAARSLLDAVIEAMEAFDVRPETVRVDLDATDDGGRWPFGFLVVNAPSADAADVTFAVEETMDQFNDWPDFKAFVDALIAVDGREEVFGTENDLGRLSLGYDTARTVPVTDTLPDGTATFRMGTCVGDDTVGITAAFINRSDAYAEAARTRTSVVDGPGAAGRPFAAAVTLTVGRHRPRQLVAVFADTADASTWCDGKEANDPLVVTGPFRIDPDTLHPVPARPARSQRAEAAEQAADATAWTPTGGTFVAAEDGSVCDTCDAPAVVCDLDAPDGEAFACADHDPRPTRRDYDPDAVTVANLPATSAVSDGDRVVAVFAYERDANAYVRDNTGMHKKWASAAHGSLLSASVVFDEGETGHGGRIALFDTVDRAEAWWASSKRLESWAMVREGLVTVDADSDLMRPIAPASTPIRFRINDQATYDALAADLVALGVIGGDQLVGLWKDDGRAWRIVVSPDATATVEDVAAAYGVAPEPSDLGMRQIDAGNPARAAALAAGGPTVAFRYEASAADAGDILTHAAAEAGWIGWDAYRSGRYDTRSGTIDVPADRAGEFTGWAARQTEEAAADGHHVQVWSDVGRDGVTPTGDMTNGGRCRIDGTSTDCCDDAWPEIGFCCEHTGEERDAALRDVPPTVGAATGSMTKGARRAAAKAIRALLPDLTRQQAVNAADGDLGAIDPIDVAAVTAITEACASGLVTCRSVVHLIGRQGADARIEGRGDRLLIHGRAGAVEAVEGAWGTTVIGRPPRGPAAVPTGLPDHGGDPLRVAKRLVRIANDGQPG